MKLTKGTITYTYLPDSYTDDNGTIWSHPTMEFLLAQGFVVVPEDLSLSTVEQIIADLTFTLEQFYDARARERNYDNRLTCALRAGYPGPFQAEGLAFAVWMDNCNAYSYDVMRSCLAGARAIPTAEELIAELPLLVWEV